MTETQTSILLRNLAKRLEAIEQQIINDLPADCAETKTVENPFKLHKDSPKNYEVTVYPILQNLKDFRRELDADAEQLKIAGMKQKVKAE